MQLFQNSRRTANLGGRPSRGRRQFCLKLPDTLLGCHDFSARSLQHYLKLIELSHEEFLLQLQGNHSPVQTKIGQSPLDVSQSVSISFGFVLKEVEGPGRAMDSQVLFQVQISQGVKHSSRQFWIR